MVSLSPPTFLLPAPLGHLLQVDSILFAEFQAWKESPTLDKSCSFLDRIYREDIGPCLDFTKQEVSAGKGGQNLCSLAAPKLSLLWRCPLHIHICTHFSLLQLSELVRVAVEQNTLTIEPVASQTLPVVKVSAEECGGPK